MQINQLFADKTMEAVKLLKDRKQDVLPLIWIHDYHLTLAAKYIRKVFFFLKQGFVRFFSSLSGFLVNL